MNINQIEELRKCALSFPYFVKNYIKILHPKHGIIPLKLYPFQERLIECYENNRFVIGTKFRQGGFTTTTILYLFWKCMFGLDKSCVMISKTDREACSLMKIVNFAINQLPEWIKPKLSKDNDHQKTFIETSCKLFSYTPQATCGQALNHLFIDEAAFYNDMESHWRGMFPVLSCGGNCIVLSTTNRDNNWFYKTYTNALDKKNNFYIFKSDHTEHPEHTLEWCKEMKKIMGEEGYRQEVLQEFIYLKEADPDAGRKDNIYKKIYHLGYTQGVEDQDEGKSIMELDLLGERYNSGYYDGFMAAKDKKWYIVAEGSDSVRWMGKPNERLYYDWVENKKDAIAFNTQKEAGELPLP